MKPWSWLLAAGVLLGLVQQQLLLRRPPRLVQVQPALSSSGPGALDLRFSRPMDQASLRNRSALVPSLPHSWLGAGQSLRLLLASGGQLKTPIALQVAGLDQRQVAMVPQRWLWDPRPRLVAVVSLPAGEQVQLQDHDGRWQALSPIWPSVPGFEVLADGSGVVLAAADRQGRQQVWRIPLRQRNLVTAPQGLRKPLVGPAQRLSHHPLLFAYFSSNQQGDLLIQSSSVASGHSQTQLWDFSDRSTALRIETSGPIRLVPQGGAMVVPHPEGLRLMGLPGQPQRRQMLPGNRDLSAFCPTGGRALLVHYRPDNTRSLELVEPGQPPRILWQGTEGVAASACASSGKRVWLLLIDGVGQPRLQILAINQVGQVLQRKQLTGWELEPGTSLEFDPSRNQLLVALRPLGLPEPGFRPGSGSGSGAALGRLAAWPALIDAASLKLRLLSKPIRQAHWLPANQL